MNPIEAPLPPLVRVIDDDEAMRRSLAFLIESVGLAVQTYARAQEFLDAPQPERTGCVLLDVRMPGMSGLELQAALTRAQLDLPIVFLTGHGDIDMAVNAMKAGAFDFIEKPFRDQRLLDAVARAVRLSEEQQAERMALRAARLAWLALTPREREVARLVADGQANRVIATTLGISERTVHIHRANALQKMATGSAAELAAALIRLGEKR